MNREQAQEQARNTAEAIARRSRNKLVAFLAARFGDIAAAEDALSDAFAAALVAWPQTGRPENPEAWLLTAARNKLLNHLRRDRKTAGGDELENMVDSAAAAAESDLPDRRLALLFVCTHPALDPGIRAPLMLQVVLGLEASQIASAFLTSPAAMAQRLVRAKAKIRDSGIPFQVPDRKELPDRLESVLDSVYAAFAEGWTDAAGTDLRRRELAGEAIYLGRLLSELLTDEPEVWGLLALMLYAEARRPARRSAAGEFVPLRSQNTALWDTQMIAEAEAALRRARGAGRIGRYQLEAAIQSAHVDGARTGSVAWDAILHLYDALVKLTASPVVAINRAIALAEVRGPAAGLAALEDIRTDPRLQSYQPYWAVRADLFARAGSHDEARHAYQIAIGMEPDPAVRDYLNRLCDKLQP